MNDKLLMSNYLLVLKSTVEVFVHGTLESSNQDVRNILKEGLDSTLKCQADTYLEMTDFGFYNIQNIDTNKISNVLNTLNG
jgi:spore coat protein CotF